MKQFEYSEGRADSDQEDCVYLKQKGLEGWQLVSVYHPVNQSISAYFYFMRELSEKTKV